jgi:hypothetical protein
MKEYFLQVEPVFDTVSTLKILRTDYELLNKKRISFILEHFASLNKIEEPIDVDIFIKLVNENECGMFSESLSVCNDNEDFIIVMAERQVNVDCYIVDENNRMCDI